LSGTLDANPQTLAAKAVLKARAFGYPDYQLRSAARARARSFPLLAAICRSTSGVQSLVRQRFTPVQALDEDFTWEATLDLAGSMARAGTNTQLTAPFWLPVEWDLAVHQRKSPLFLNYGYPLTLEQDFTIKLPSGTLFRSVPEPAASAGKPLSWQVQWRVEGPEIHAVLNATLHSGELTLDQTSTFQQQLLQLRTALASPAVVD
jgi:hypothetical protein